jgi:hypothetical protein
MPDVRLCPLLVCAFALAGCGSHHPGTGGGPEGELVAEVLLPQVVLDAMTFRLHGGSITPIVEVVPVRGSGSTLAFFAGIPAGKGYQLDVTAISRDGASSCRAASPVDIRAGQTTRVTLSLACTTIRGEATVNAIIHCTMISSLVTAPLFTSVGGSVDLQARIVDLGTGQPRLSWSSSAGTFADAAAANTTFTCTRLGQAVIALDVAFGQCTDRITTTVTCVQP